jgi:DNA repair exonuclease SbcCD ATPase subunit
MLNLRTKMPDSPETRRGRLKKLTIEGFRGFRDQAVFDLDASAVLITGPNGTGKTSIFDAVLWILVGDVARLSGYTLRRNEEYLRNAYVRGNGLAMAELEVEVSGQRLVARRVGSALGSSLTVQIGTESFVDQEAGRALESALVQGELPLREVMATSGLLQQDDLRQLLQTKPDQRYRQLLRLLGLEAVERFDRHSLSERDSKRAAVRKARDVLERIRIESERMSEQLETAKVQALAKVVAQEQPTSVIGRVLESVPDLLSFEGQPSTPEDLAALAASARNLATQIERVHDRLQTLAADTPVDPAAAIQQAGVETAQLEESLAQALQLQRQAAEALRVATVAQDALGRLAAAAIPLLDAHAESGPCPVCQSLINPRLVGEELSTRAASAAAQAEAESVVRAAGDEVRRIEVAIEALNRDMTPLRAQAAQRSQYLVTLRRSLDALEALQQQSHSGVHLAVDIGRLLDVARSIDTDAEESGTADLLFREWTESREPLTVRLNAVIRGLVTIADSVETAGATSMAVRNAAERSAALPRQQARYEGQLARQQQAQQDYDDARRAETAATALSQSVTSAATELFRERFAALEPLMNDIYARLDPHPAFTRLDFRVETYRSKGTATANVMDVDEDISANPMIVFSSAQANAVVLSAFLALGWASAERGVPFVLLDDPLQALDDVNVLGFADLARRLRRQRQIVLATHEDRFADLLERKLTGRAEGEDLIVHRFLGWSRSGPTVDTRRVTARPDLRLRVLEAS